MKCSEQADPLPPKGDKSSLIGGKADGNLQHGCLDAKFSFTDPARSLSRPSPMSKLSARW